MPYLSLTSCTDAGPAVHRGSAVDQVDVDLWRRNFEELLTIIFVEQHLSFKFPLEASHHELSGVELLLFQRAERRREKKYGL